MKYEAVIFDLGGTLVQSPSWFDYEDAARKIALILNAPVEEFVRLWFAQGEGFGTGVFASYGALIRHVCNQLGTNVEDRLVESASKIPYNLTKKMITVPRDDAMEVLKQLKSNSYKIGLISDCGPDVPEIWTEIPFADLMDVVIFSCAAGMNKAGTRIFQLAAAELSVEPERCLYVADGNRHELANATKLGMYAIRLLIPGEINDNPMREKWNGHTIPSLTEVVGILL